MRIEVPSPYNPPGVAAEVIVAVRELNMRQAQSFDITLPAHRRLIFKGCHVVHNLVTGLSVPAGLKIVERDERVTTGDVAAALETSFAAPDSNLVFTAKTAGAVGDEIGIVLEKDTEAPTLLVTVSDGIITVRLALDGNDDIVTTAAEVLAAIGALPEADALVAVALAVGEDGSGVVEELDASLTGGVDGEVRQTVLDEALDEALTVTEGVEFLASETNKGVRIGANFRVTVTPSTADAHDADLLLSFIQH